MITAGDLCRRLEGTLEGDPDRTITAVRPPERATATEVAYLAAGRSLPEGCDAGVLIVSADADLAASPDRSLIRHSHPRLAFARAIAAIHPSPAPATGVASTAAVDPSAEIAEGVHVGENAVVGPGVRIAAGARVGAGAVLTARITIGPDCDIHPRVTIYPDCHLGRGVRILSGAVIGSDGFGFEPSPSGIERIPHVGGVRIGDFAEIGANTTIDRGVLDDTVIGPMVKLDNLVHVAHNCDLGAGTLAAAQVGIAGSTRVGKGVIFAGQSGVAGHLDIGDGVRVGAQSAVLQSVPAGSEVLGCPAAPSHHMKRVFACMSRLPDMRRQLRDLDDRITRVEES